MEVRMEGRIAILKVSWVALEEDQGKGGDEEEEATGNEWVKMERTSWRGRTHGRSWRKWMTKRRRE